MKTPKSPHSTVTMLTSDIKCLIAFFSKRHDLGEKLRLKLRTLSVYCSEALGGNIVDIFLTVEFCNILSSNSLRFPHLCIHICPSAHSGSSSDLFFWSSVHEAITLLESKVSNPEPECSSITVVNTQSLCRFSWADGQHGTLWQLYVNFMVQYICFKSEFVFCYLAIKESIFYLMFLYFLGQWTMSEEWF